MNTLTLRTRSVNVSAASSSSRLSSWNPARRPANTSRAFRPVFVSSPTAKRSHVTVRRAA